MEKVTTGGEVARGIREKENRRKGVERWKPRVGKEGKRVGRVRDFRERDCGFNCRKIGENVYNLSEIGSTRPIFYSQIFCLKCCLKLTLSCPVGQGLSSMLGFCPPKKKNIENLQRAVGWTYRLR